MKKTVITLGLLSAFLATSVLASDADITKTFEKLGYPANSIKIKQIEVNGFKKVITPEGILYVSSDGKFLTTGPIYNVQGAQPENIDNSANLDLIRTIDKDAIVYKAANEKYIVYVFTDYTCQYCQVLHENINDYLKLGISIHYFAFPRSGINSTVAQQMESVWSMADRKKAFESVYKGNKIELTDSKKNHVKDQFNVGVDIGITGTPAMVLPNGQLISGYVPADKLIKELDRVSSN